ncbi:DNA-binding protein [Geoanaerobacter pelophilus]|uniref:DNA-binding protein n=1 Tax=Geoanaerobacter pelophilus TaxID=60036 RepID=A0ABQ0MGT6_9BACT|nr:helix-hairpin-helix domain-containing protein [Geoanaerobacter pelophilus]GAW66292.1 DNA-binding protein [Geoanaerobacter pelophilus]
MVQSTEDLKRLRGVGIVLGKRLFDAGFDSIAKIAEAGEEGLKKVRGVSPRAISSIVDQSRQLAGMSQHPGKGPEEVMQRRVAEVRGMVETLAEKTRDRFGQEMSKGCGKKISSDLNRIEMALLQMHDFGKKRSKRVDKALVKAEKRVTGLEDATLKKVRKGFKRAKKAVLKALR